MVCRKSSWAHHVSPERKGRNMRVYQFWVKFWPAPDLPGQWIAHCLDFDVVTQGNSLPHVMNMVLEAVGMTICDDLDDGRDPSERRAPAEFWEDMYSGVASSTPHRLSDIVSDPSFSGTVYANLEIAVRKTELPHQNPVGVAMVA